LLLLVVAALLLLSPAGASCCCCWLHCMLLPGDACREPLRGVLLPLNSLL
jgi:hypothetical protein